MRCCTATRGHPHHQPSDKVVEPGTHRFHLQYWMTQRLLEMVRIMCHSRSVVTYVVASSNANVDSCHLLQFITRTPSNSWSRCNKPRKASSRHQVLCEAVRCYSCPLLSWPCHAVLCCAHITMGGASRPIRQTSFRCGSAWCWSPS